MVSLIVIRHGFSQGNKEKLFTGQLDVPLDEAGLSQAQSITAHLLNNYQIDCIYSSDLSRAVDTVKPLAEALQLPIHTSTLLRETNEGYWQGMRVVDIKSTYPEDFARYKKDIGHFRFKDGECYTDVMLRGKRILQEIAEKHPGKAVVIATHGGFIRAMSMDWLQIPLDKFSQIPVVPNGSVTIVEYHSDHVSIPTMGYTGHLANPVTEELVL